MDLTASKPRRKKLEFLSLEEIVAKLIFSLAVIVLILYCF